MNDERIEVLYRRGEIDDYQKDILSGKLVDLFLPASFIDSDGASGAVYDTTGYVRIDEAGKLKASTMIAVVSEILEKSIAAEKRMFFTGEYSLDKEYVYLDPDTMDVELIYRKTEQRTKGLILRDLSSLLMVPGICAEGSEYIEKAKLILGELGTCFSVMTRKLKMLGGEAFRMGV